VTQKYLRRFTKNEGVLYVGKAQEKARIMRTERRRSRVTGGTYPWIVESTAMVNHYYFYCVDEDFGPFFLKFCSYFPYNAKLCINGHEYLRFCELKRRSTTPATSPSAGASKIWKNCVRSALRPTDVCSTSNASVTIASSAKLPFRKCRNPSSSTLGAPQDCGLPIRASRLSCTSCSSSSLVQGTFRHSDLREHLASLLGKQPSQFSPGRITYDLRRLRFHGLIERIPKTHRYRITAKGLRTALFYTQLYDRSLRTALAVISPNATNPELPLAKSIRAAEAAINKWYEHAKLAA
jgi:hypothetical protein